jgi:Fur family zinc uptake transcriptional regulator
MIPTADKNHSHLDSKEQGHTQCVGEAIVFAEKICLARGVRLTPIRHQVLKLIWDSHKAVKAYDLLEWIRPLQKTAKPSTIYRALDFLIKQGLIHRVESLNAFVACSCSEHQHDSLLLICKHCNEVEERPAPKVMDALAQELNQSGFVLQSKALEAQGICGRCSAHLVNQT